MDFFDSIKASSSGLSAQRLRMNLISGNLANVNTTRTKEGGPYRRKEAIFAAQPVESSFKKILKERQNKHLSGVKVVRIYEDPNPPVNMISATRGYEANVTALKAAKDMAMKALEIGR
jgi:flagellar basal-body rod protein FlgC